MSSMITVLSVLIFVGFITGMAYFYNKDIKALLLLLFISVLELSRTKLIPSWFGLIVIIMLVINIALTIKKHYWGG